MDRFPGKEMDGWAASTLETGRGRFSHAGGDHGDANSLNASPRRSVAAFAWVGKGGFNITSTRELNDEMCRGKGPLFENSTRDDLSSKNESKRVKTDRDTSLER